MATSGPHPFEEKFDQYLRFRNIYRLYTGDESEKEQSKALLRELQQQGLLASFRAYATEAAEFVKEQQQIKKESAYKMQAAKHDVQEIDVRLAALKEEKKAVITKFASENVDDIRGFKTTTPPASNGHIPAKKKKGGCAVM